MTPYNPEDIIKYLDETQTLEEKKYLESPEGQEKYKQFKQMCDDTHKELKDVNKL
jgi:hypothetical protein